MKTRTTDLSKELKKYFGFSQFKGQQEKIIQTLLDNQDVFVLMPTGGGKSLCYQVPALFLEGVTLVISPLISLMQDQVMNLKEHGIDAVFINSSQSYEEALASKRLIQSKRVKLVYLYSFIL